MLQAYKNKAKAILTHSGFRRYFANTTWMFAEQMLRLLSGLFVGVWVARYLGPTNFGSYNYALTYVSIFAGIAKLGLDSVIVSKIIIQPELQSEYISAGFWLKLFAGLITILAISFSLIVIDNSTQTTLYILIIASGFILQPFEVVDFYYQSQARITPVTLCKLIQLLISTILKIYLILIKAELVWFVIITLIDQVTLSVGYFILISKANINLIKNVRLNIVINMIKSGLPLLTAGLLWGACMRVDQIIIQHRLDDYHLGIYSAALRIVELTHIIPVVICTALFPSIIATKKRSQAAYDSRLGMLFSITLWLGLITCLTINIFSAQITSLLFGSKYEEAGHLTALLAWSSFFVFFGTVISYWLTAEEKQGVLVKATFLILVFNVVTNYYLIPIYGVWAASIIKIVSYASLYTYILSIFLKNWQPIKFFINGITLHTYFK